ncbi:leucyl aminopeptidase [Agromyces sp. Leaf222]|uniref:leucyl aminopeptidase n=1 Tax=Agromyces sp. Leaf222 TaxID=1735688 RepID=UPI000701D058|nr:leucyl aminopeptidase [Agromyces sp. Leaf222]KQM83510.1 aminopeptidase [Agromyces sp. Leaf222]
MSVPELRTSELPPTASEADVVLLTAVSTPDGPRLLDVDGYAWVAPLLAGLGVSGAADELVRIPSSGDGPAVVAVAGVGERADAASLRLAVGSALRQLTGVSHVAVAVPDALDGQEPDAASEGSPAEAMLEGAALGAYLYTTYRSEPKTPVAVVTVHAPASADRVRVERVRIIADAVHRTKDLVNAAPADLSPARLAEIAVDTADVLGVTSTVWDEEALESDGFGGILGVGQGSSRGPRLVRLEYAPTTASHHLALVGKGITFDSGGLSLKPGGSMVGMKSDMAGAATVLSAILALAALEAPIRVTGWLCLAENMPSGTAIRPNDVLRIRGGKTVEVLNTDAEGRLVLADGLVAASEEQPDAIVDVATLTGAQVVALGHRMGGLMGDDSLVGRVRASADSVDEAFWPMPLPGYLKANLKSDVADLANTRLGTTIPGMLVAGVFLREFVGRREDSGERIPWAHLDIAGPSFNQAGAWGHTGSGGTAIGVRTLIALGEDLSAG